MTINDTAWSKIFDDLQILETLKNKSIFVITAKQINQIGKREARLMAKFDTKESLPNLFKSYQLNINAISNGSYIIFKDPLNKSFITLPDYTAIVPKKIRPQLDFELQTLIFNTRMSESNAIDFAHHSKILSAYSGEETLKLTTRGRFFSDLFTFRLSEFEDINVKGVQIEVDGGYEGHEQFLIIEAKCSTRLSFNIWQLYYPYRHFRNKTSKRIRPILLSFSNGIYYFTEVGLTFDYNEYSIINNDAYEVIVEEPIERITLKELLSLQTKTPITVPVPQADDLNKVIDLLSFLLNNDANKFAIAAYFEFDERQGDYYGNAAVYLSLAQKSNSVYTLTDLGQQIIQIKNRTRRNLMLTKSILKTKLFNDLLNLYYKQNEKIDDQQIIYRIAEEGLAGSTPVRRKSTIRSWLRWIIENLNDLKKT